MLGVGSRRALVIVAVASAVTAAAVAVPVAFAAGRYSDVPEDSIYARAVERLGASGVIKGCGDGTAFCPQSNVTRGQLALLLDRMSGQGDVPPSVDAATVMGLTPEQLRGQTGPEGPQGPRGPEGPQGPAGTAVALERVASGGQGINYFRTRLVSMELPAGAWALSGSVGLRAQVTAHAPTGSTVYIECSLEVPSGALTRAEETFFLPPSGASQRRNLALTATITSTTPTTVELICVDSSATDSFHSEPPTSLAAVQVTTQTRTIQR